MYRCLKLASISLVCFSFHTLSHLFVQALLYYEKALKLDREPAEAYFTQVWPGRGRPQPSVCTVDKLFAEAARAHLKAQDPDEKVLALSDEYFARLSDEALIARVLREHKCPHGCFGVARRSATELSSEELFVVRKRYLRFSTRLHPDKQQHTDARKAFAAMDTAYKSLIAGK